MTTRESLTPAHADLLARFRDGQRAALARVISIVENQRDGFQSLLHELHPGMQGAKRIGITGPPGAGKSTITADLIRRLRERGETVGVIAVDPTSPYTGGALLGDRIRMGEVAQGEGVFIRSMATRGALGGIAAATREVMDVMAAFGFDVVIVETVGVGQSELDIAAAADTTVVVLVPESGDAIQTMKAGLMEAADLFVVNKADRPGAPKLAKEVEMMIHLRLGDGLRNVPAHHGVQLKRAGTARAKMAARRRLDPGGEPDSGGSAGSTGEPDSTGSLGDATSPSDSPNGSTSNQMADREDASGDPASAGDSTAGWSIPVLLTSAEKGEGMAELVERLDTHAGWLRDSGELERRRRGRLEERVRDAVEQRLLIRAWQEGNGRAIMDAAMADLVAGETTPYAVADRIVAALDG